MKLLIFITLGLYMIFLYMDISNNSAFISSKYLKFISILLCFGIALLDGIMKGMGRDSLLLQGSLFFTIVADYIFLIYNKKFQIAIGLFSIVQIIYMIRYSSQDIILKLMWLIISGLLISTIYLYMSLLMGKIHIILPFALFYALCFLMSLRETLRAYKSKIYPRPNRELILAGMILFLLCDINVALYNIIGHISNKGKLLNVLYNISSISIWLYYLPSQLLLALSGCKNYKIVE